MKVDDFLLNARIKSLPLCSLIFVWCDGKVNGVFAAHKTTAVEMSLILILSLTESNYCTCMAPLQAFWCCCRKVPTVSIVTHRFVFHRKASAVIALPVKATFTKGLLQGQFCCRTVYGTEFTLLCKTYFTGSHIFKLLLLSNKQSLNLLSKIKKRKAAWSHVQQRMFYIHAWKIIETINRLKIVELIFFSLSNPLIVAALIWSLTQ